MQNRMKIGITLNKTICIFLISEKHSKTFFNIKTHNIHAWENQGSVCPTMLYKEQVNLECEERSTRNHQFSPTGKLSDSKEKLKTGHYWQTDYCSFWLSFGYHKLATFFLRSKNFFSHIPLRYKPDL